MKSKLTIDDITPEEAAAELDRRERVKSLLPAGTTSGGPTSAAEPSIPSEKKGLDWQGLLNVKPHFMQNVQELVNRPEMQALTGAQDAVQKALALGAFTPTPRGEGRYYDIGKDIGKVGGTALAAGLYGPLAATLIPAGIKARALDRANELKEKLVESPYQLSKAFLNEQELPRRLPEPPPSEPSLGGADTIKNDLIKSITEDRSLAQSQKEAAKKLAEALHVQKNASKNNFETLFNQKNEGGSSLEPTIGARKLIQAQPGQLGLIENTSIFPKNISDTFTSDINQFYNKVKNDPSIINGHKLRSQLGSEINDLNMKKYKSGLDQAEQNRLYAYKTAQKKLDNLIENNLKGTPYYNDYKNAIDYHRENVGIFTKDPAIAEIATGKIKNPGNLHNIFKNPEPHTEAVLSHVGPEFKNMVLHSKLGDIENGIKPNEALNLKKKLINSGLSNYLDNEKLNKLNAYENEFNKENLSKKQFEKEMEYYGIHNKKLLEQYNKDISEKGKLTKPALAAIGSIAGSIIGGPLTGAGGAALGYLSRPMLEKLARAIIKSRESKGI